jgi:hypothetical protein
MKIELKKISFNERMSEETNCFVADLYINGKKVGYCKNDGRGGCTDYNSYNPEDRKVIADAEVYCKALPQTEWKDMKFDQSLESVIDQLLEDWFKERGKKKIEKQMQTAILFGVPDGDMYVKLMFKRPLSTMPLTFLQAKVNEIIKTDCKDGVVILNTNLEKLGVKI